MSARRTLIIIVAIALGVVAAVATVLYVNSVQSRANHDAKLVAVYLVAKDIPKNTTGDTAIAAGLVKTGKIPKSFYPATAVTNINAIKGKVAASALPAGEVLVDRQFVEQKVAQANFSATNIPAGQVAVSVQVDALKAVGGLIVPGDKVDLIIAIDPATKSGVPVLPAGAVAAGSQDKFARLLYQNVSVVAIGATVAPKPGDTAAVTNPQTSNVYTLAVPAEAAERILLASAGPGLTLALVPPDNQPANVAPVQLREIENTPGGFAPAPGLTPYGQ
ncbi:MAG: hypothetical protein NVS3B21_00860 [Acidimicrobiales bacterium]